ncbi:MAG: endonuclease/exonuclease/phosphatase family protein [Neisseriaceae bacterium]|nr:endonuclease/exonuclease/phosphatase family protein [Neisseriaceae bacterium]MBP6861137.1 endonuclease/exonuclease/phosphatase family protein [Neisseriaceae bacterium]
MKIVLYVFSALLVLTTLLPLWRSDHWTVRVFDYPRLQKLVLIVLCLVGFVPFWPGLTLIDGLVMGALGLCALYLAWVIYPYTPLGPKMIERVALRPDEVPLRLLVANVLQYNTDYTRLVSLIQETEPDVMLMLETNQAWLDHLRPATDAYPYRVEVPLENTYGLLLYAKLPLSNEQVNYLISEEIPSVIVDVAYQGQTIRLYGVHPTPPVPQENEESTERDAEILMVGKMAKAYGEAAIVFGDLNDVAWSRTTQLFLKTSQLLDARRGRGLFSTFHADHRVLRWPLDHYFLSSQFRLIDFKVERHIGSDHFPISMAVVLRQDDTAGEEALDAEERVEVNEKIAAGVEKGDATP